MNTNEKLLVVFLICSLLILRWSESIFSCKDSSYNLMPIANNLTWLSNRVNMFTASKQKLWFASVLNVVILLFFLTEGSSIGAESESFPVLMKSLLDKVILFSWRFNQFPQRWSFFSRTIRFTYWTLIRIEGCCNDV